MHESPPSLAQLKAQFAPAPAAGGQPALFALGVAAVDGPLGGGLPRGRLHEVLPAAAGDAASAAAFALLLAARATDGALFWIGQPRPGQPRLHGPGIAELGIDPGRLLFVDAPDETALLRAAADALRSSAAGAVILAPADRARRLDLTASRRLTLAAEAQGATAIVLKSAGDEAPSAAASRWRIAAAPSAPLAAGAPGHPAFAVELLRHRFGVAHPGWRLHWDCDEAAFRLAAPPADHAPAIRFPAASQGRGTPLALAPHRIARGERHGPRPAPGQR